MLNLKKNSLVWALKNINIYNDTYIFPKPFEFDAINEYDSEVIDYLSNIDIYGNGTRPYRTAITPKSQLGFRISTQLDPLDSLISNAIIYEIYNDLESYRLNCSEERVFSFRLDPKPDGTLYNPNFTWDSFNEKAKKLSEDDKYAYVIVTDIADFYSSIYLHNIETYLKEVVRTSGKIAHADVLINMIKSMHSHQTHKGLPIGPQFSRPIAEIILNDIDRIFLELNIEFIRCVDDYRIFCKTEPEAYRTLASIAEIFYNMRGLKLSEHKTKILTTEEFIRHYIKSFKEEHERLTEEFFTVLDQLGISTNIYDDIDLDELSEEDIREIEKLNIFELLENELTKENIDLGYAKVLIGNLAKFDNTNVANLILKQENIIRITPILKSVIDYLERVRSFDQGQKHEIGRKVIDILSHSYIAELAYTRTWLLNLFTKNEEWDNKECFKTFHQRFNDSFTQRELILCFGRSQSTDFFRLHRMDNFDTLNPWIKRAYIAGFSCLPKDERKAWFETRKGFNRDYLEKIVEKWALKNHF